MATGNIQVTEGSGKYIATNTISEDAVTKGVQRFVPNNSSGVEIATQANPFYVVSSISGTTGASVIGLPPFNLTAISGGAINMTGNGAVGVNTLRVAIASDSSGPGSVIAFQGGAWSASMVGVASVSGVGLFNVNHTGNGSVLSIPTSSTIALIQANSIVGTYLEDNPHTSGDKGIFALNVRNDTMSSVTSADGDYGAMSIGPTGEVITANSPITKWFSAQTSVMYGTSVQAIAPQGTSVFTYISGVQVANNSGTFSLVKITGGLGSVLGWTVAPANGGSNIQFLNPIKTGENSGVSASINGVSSVYISMQGFISKT